MGYPPFCTKVVLVIADNNQESVSAYVADYECLVDGVIYLLRIRQEIAESGNIEAIIRHYKAHPEDKLCHIYRPGTREQVSCRRSGIDAIHRTASRLASEAPNSCDLSAKRIAEIISERVLQVAIDGITSDGELVRVLKSYVAISELEHVEAIHYFPCILFHRGQTHPDFAPSPNEVTLGPVKFQHFSKFLEELTKAAERKEKHLEDKTLDIFSSASEKYGWIASVGIPRCAPDVSRRRAEQVVETAINLLKLFIGLRHGKSMRLPHTTASRNRETCMLTEINGNVAWRWQGKALDGALVVGDLVADLCAAEHQFACLLLEKSLSGKRSEATNRLIDALKWFGDASFEESSGVQIVKWVAALERLIAVERLHRGIFHRFCKRVALLASGLGSGNVERAYRDARTAYELRSDIMHGSRSQDDEQLARNAGLVHDLTREAIVGALAAHHLLDSRVGDASTGSIQKLYSLTAVKSETLFGLLKNEYKKGTQSI